MINNKEWFTEFTPTTVQDLVYKLNPSYMKKSHPFKLLLFMKLLILATL